MKTKSARSKSTVLRTVNVSDHPLRGVCRVLSSEDSVDSVKSSVKRQESRDTKLVTTTWDGLDPLSLALSTSTNGLVRESLGNGVNSKQSGGRSRFIGADFTDWLSYKSQILNRFNTTEKLSIKTSFVFDKAIHNSNLKLPSAVSQKVKNRLEQLDEVEENCPQEMLNLSQQEYIKRIDDFNTALSDAWESDQRVKALKIAIQCAKQLSSTNGIHFYPSKFVLITDILDNFGKLVYERISTKITSAREDAQETCRNWFYKISSIRELLPRFYIETSIVNIYGFLINEKHLYEEYEKIFLRLTKMVRGIGDPLVASYCRVYLCRAIINTHPEVKHIFELNIFDAINSINMIMPASLQQTLQQKVDNSVYFSLYNPAIDWILKCHFYKGNDSLYEKVLSFFSKNMSSQIHQVGCIALILNSLIKCYPSSFVSKHLMEFTQSISNLIDILEDSKNNDSIYPIYILIKNLGESVNNEMNFFENYLIDQNVFFQEFWKIVGKLKQNYEFIICMEVWSEVIAKYNTVTDINELLGKVVTKAERDTENYSTQLLTILTKVTQFGSERFDCNTFFLMSNLLSYLDLFHKEDIKVEACKTVVSSYVQNCSRANCQDLNSYPGDGTTSDPVIINTLTYICKLMHNSINALTLEDDKRQISALIIGFIKQISFHRDFEAQLNFYVESRANFSNLDLVLCFIVQQVNALAMETHRAVNGNHTKKTISLVSACIAFSYITIPSIDEVTMRLQLYLSSSQVSLVNVCLPQTDAFLKSAITTLRQLPSHSEGPDGKLYSNDEFLHSLVAQLLSTLIVVPDNPELGILYLFKGLYNVLKEYKFDLTSQFKLLTWINLIRYLSTCASDNYPYHVDKVDSNDALYAQEEEFLKETQTYCDIVLQETLDIFKKSHVELMESITKRCNTALELINLLLSYSNIDSTGHVVTQLWSWISKYHQKYNLKSMEPKMKRTFDLIREDLKSNGAA